MQKRPEIDYVVLANTKAKGKRPAYLADPAQDRLLSIVMALVGEVGVLRERLDTVERLLTQKNTLSQSEIDLYTPDRDAQYDRGLLQREFIARVLRSVQQDMEALNDIEPPLEDVIKTLRDT
jgi:hypothetical protein